MFFKGIIFEKTNPMRNIYLLVLLIIAISGCKEKKTEQTDVEQEELSVLEHIARAHGSEQWPSVEEIKFTFNVDRDTLHFERSWIWKIRDHQVSAVTDGDTITYNRKAVDSTLQDVDSHFINDKYWLLAPYNLIWDQDNFTYEHQEGSVSPIANKPMHKLTIVYGNVGGYTPGDAYDFYFEDDYIIREWVFRKGNQQEPSTITTWEGYETIGGLKISKMHKNAEDTFSISFTDVSVR